MREFLTGARFLGQGWAWWNRNPRAMAIGLIPGALVWLFMMALLVFLLIYLGRIGDWLTPFADDWSPGWERTAELLAEVVVLAGALILIALTFTALTLAVGDRFYERLWRTVERETTGTVPDNSAAAHNGIVDDLALAMRSIGAAALTAVIGVLPGIGTVVSWVVGVLFTGWLLAHELTSRALVARGIDRHQRNTLLKTHRARTLGFGISTQLCFMVPGGPVATMPPAVVGSTLLVQSMLTPSPSTLGPQFIIPASEKPRQPLP